MAQDRKIAHLTFIQSVIVTMTCLSFAVKAGSLATVLTFLAVSAPESRSVLMLLAILPVKFFWVLDGYYLWQERQFRFAYDRVRVAKDEKIDFNILFHARSFLDNNLNPCRWSQSIFSVTLVLFHGALLATILVAALLWLPVDLQQV